MIELLVVSGIVAVLASFSVPILRVVLEDADRVGCLNRMSQIGRATHLYAAEHEGSLPRSFHSAGAHRELNWSSSIAPFLGVPESEMESNWPRIFEKHFRCPSDRSHDAMIYSYGLNVHFELDPDGDDYVGSPAQWRRLHSVPHPSRTILLAETRPVPFGDHLMCHQWSGIQAARNALSSDRHGRQSHFLFVDGHVELLPVEKTLDLSQAVNLWNPSLAR